MRAVTRATQGHRSLTRLARCLPVLAICVFAMATGDSRDRDDDDFGGKGLKRFLLNLSRRVRQLEETVSVLSSEECQTGLMDFSICPGFKETSTQVILDCVTSPSSGGGVNITDMTVTFAHSFSRRPTVVAAYSGLAFLQAKNSSLQVKDVQQGQFTVRQVADDFLPVATQASFFACPSALE